MRRSGGNGASSVRDRRPRVPLQTGCSLASGPAKPPVHRRGAGDLAPSTSPSRAEALAERLRACQGRFAGAVPANVGGWLTVDRPATLADRHIVRECQNARGLVGTVHGLHEWLGGGLRGVSGKHDLKWPRCMKSSAASRWAKPNGFLAAAPPYVRNTCSARSR